MKPSRLINHLAIPLSATLLANCSAPISVTTVRPEPPPGVTSSNTAACLLADIRASEVPAASGDAAALIRYNHSVARLIEAVGYLKSDPWGGITIVSDACGAFTLKCLAPADVATGTSQLIPTDTLRMKGEYGETRPVVAGFGAPLVAVDRLERIGRSEIRRKIPVRNLTAVVRFRGTDAEIELLDPLQVETVLVGGKRRTLAADYGAAMQLGLSKSRIDKLGFSRLLHPSRYDDTAQLNFLQPYDPKRIPVLLVHGLDSTPATFAPMVFRLLEDPEIRRNYQFWVFSYPSGYPFHYSAALLRRELDEVNSAFPGHRGIVIVGHSMGGILSRMMITDAGERLWLKAFGKRPSETPVIGKSRRLLEETLIFHDRREIDRAIFFSAPHRGASLATNPISLAFAKLVKTPGAIADVRNTALSLATADQAGLLLQSAPNSIGTLSPRNPFVLAVNEIPISRRVPHHSVIGDRGKGDTPDSSDGVVPYWSSHVATAVSEKIVSSGHGSHAHPDGIAEACRILKLHLRSNR